MHRISKQLEHDKWSRPPAMRIEPQPNRFSRDFRFPPGERVRQRQHALDETELFDRERAKDRQGAGTSGKEFNFRKFVIDSTTKRA